LYRHKPATGDRPGYVQLVVPASMRKYFMHQAHVGMTGGHYGNKRTQDQVQGTKTGILAWLAEGC